MTEAREARVQRRRTETTNQVRLMSFTTGTSTLAKRTMSASGQYPRRTSAPMPEMMVSACGRPRRPTAMIGRTLAGK